MIFRPLEYEADDRYCTRGAGVEDAEMRREMRREMERCRKIRNCPGYERVIGLKYNRKV